MIDHDDNDYIVSPFSIREELWLALDAIYFHLRLDEWHSVSAWRAKLRLGFPIQVAAHVLECWLDDRRMKLDDRRMKEVPEK